MGSWLGQMGAEVWKRLTTEHVTRGRMPGQSEVTSQSAVLGTLLWDRVDGR